MRKAYTKDDLHDIDHPDFELHDLTSLAELSGHHATNGLQLVAGGKVNIVAAKFRKAKNHILITKDEADRLRALGAERRARGLGPRN